jgi:hypothetical protein
MSESVNSPVVFDFTTWATRYPEFSETVSDPNLAALYFAEAQLYLDNGQCATIPTDVRALLLNMLVAHIASLNVGINGSPASGLVGRINQATQGSVSVSADMGTAGSSTNSAAWLQQTKYGAAFLQACAAYRLGGYYYPGSQPYFGYRRGYGGYGYGRY